jgi:hypothetical protein
MTWQDIRLWFGREILRPVSFDCKDSESTKKRLSDQTEDRTRFFPNTNVNH